MRLILDPNRLGLLALSAMLVILVVGMVAAEVPRVINYQGRLTDDAGQSVGNGEYPIRFRIHDDSTAYSPVWTSQPETVLVVNGLFNYQLGAHEPIPPWTFNDSALWLGITIGSGPEVEEISPRARLVSAPYAFKAYRAEYAGYADSAGTTLSGDGGWVDDGSIVRLATNSDYVGIGISSPTHRVHIVGSEGQPLLNVEKSGAGRAVRVSSTSACALWVENSGNHGLRVTNANGDGVHVTQAGGYAGYFNGDGFFSGDVGLGTLSPLEKLDVVGGSIRTDNQLVSTVVTGTAPLGVNSETMVANLNADMLDGQHGGDFASASHSHSATKACADVYEGMTNSSSQITVTFPVSFDAVPHFSVSAFIKSGGQAGKAAHVVVASLTTSSVTVTIQYWDGVILDGVGDSVEVQLSYTAFEK
jgi:hypothetical protein